MSGRSEMPKHATLHEPSRTKSQTLSKYVLVRGIAQDPLPEVRGRLNVSYAQASQFRGGQRNRRTGSDRIEQAVPVPGLGNQEALHLRHGFSGSGRAGPQVEAGTSPEP